MEFTKAIAKTFGSFKNVPFVPIIIDEQMKIFTLFFRPRVFSNMITLTAWIKQLKGISTKYHKYGGMEFTVNGREVCHIHGDGLVDVKLDKDSKPRFLEQRGVEDHHVNKGSNMISYQLTSAEDITLIQEVIKSAYEKKLVN